MRIDEGIREGVIESLPEAKQIRDRELRERVYDTWAISLGTSQYTRIEEIPSTGSTLRCRRAYRRASRTSPAPTQWRGSSSRGAL